MTRHLVAMARCHGAGDNPYGEFPYAPGEAYPELPEVELGPPNPVYAAVRQCLWRLGLDRANFGTARWNPLGGLIRPGEQVLIKPNWVLHTCRGNGNILGLLTHSAVLRPIIDYVLLALRGGGRLLIGDAPLQSADFAELMARTRAKELVDQAAPRGVPIDIRDFRENVCELDDKGRVVGRRSLPGDPAGYCTVDVGRESWLYPVSSGSWRFRVTNYDPAAMRRHHEADRHEYLIARAVLESDVVINVPKLKTHRKAGLTGCLKNIVGINGSKDYLPHHRLGSTKEGGDEYRFSSMWKRACSGIVDRLEGSPAPFFPGIWQVALRACRRMAHHFASDPYYEGSWYGNDTIWRTVLDLNRILKCAQPDGTLATSPRRRVFHVVDAVVAGGSEGPLRPDPVGARVVLAGREAAAVDACAARLVGFDPTRIPLVRHGLELLRGEAGQEIDIRLASDSDRNPGVELNRVQPVAFLPPSAGWVGHVELTPPQEARTPFVSDRADFHARIADE